MTNNDNHPPQSQPAAPKRTAPSLAEHLARREDLFQEKLRQQLREKDGEGRSVAGYVSPFTRSTTATSNNSKPTSATTRTTTTSSDASSQLFASLRFDGGSISLAEATYLQDELMQSKVLQDGEVPGSYRRRSTANVSLQPQDSSAALQSSISSLMRVRDELIMSKVMQEGEVPERFRNSSSSSIGHGSFRSNPASSSLLMLQDELLQSKLLQDSAVSERYQRQASAIPSSNTRASQPPGEATLAKNAPPSVAVTDQDCHGLQAELILSKLTANGLVPEGLWQQQKRVQEESNATRPGTIESDRSLQYELIMSKLNQNGQVPDELLAEKPLYQQSQDQVQEKQQQIKMLEQAQQLQREQHTKDIQATRSAAREHDRSLQHDLILSKLTQNGQVPEELVLLPPPQPQKEEQVQNEIEARRAAAL